MAEGVLTRLLAAGDLPAYKALRDTVLASAPEAFTTDAAEALGQPAQAYLPRLGLDRPDGGHFTAGAWHAGELVGAVTCERDARLKGRHIGHVAGMMVLGGWQGRGIGRLLLNECITQARRAPGLEMLTLSVTSSNVAAVGLYQSVGFKRYGTLARAIKLGGQYHDKDLMAIDL
jgi:ribosomal protein S18 acetylase RimI-like enzyme